MKKHEIRKKKRSIYNYQLSTIIENKIILGLLQNINNA